MSGYSLRRADIHCKSYTLAWSTLVSIAGRLPPIDSSVYMGNVFYSAERSDREWKEN